MKKLLLFALLIFSISVNAQSSQNLSKEYKTYCNLMGWNFWGIGKVKVRIDFGRNEYDNILDDNGKLMKFPTMMSALDYMSKRGWSLHSTFIVSENKENVIHYLLEKTVTNDSQILEGINVTPSKPEIEYKPGKNGDDLY